MMLPITVKQSNKQMKKLFYSVNLEFSVEVKMVFDIDCLI